MPSYGPLFIIPPFSTHSYYFISSLDSATFFLCIDRSSESNYNIISYIYPLPIFYADYLLWKLFGIKNVHRFCSFLSANVYCFCIIK